MNDRVTGFFIFVKNVQGHSVQISSRLVGLPRVIFPSALRAWADEYPVTGPKACGVVGKVLGVLDVQVVASVRHVCDRQLVPDPHDDDDAVAVRL